MSFPRYPAYKPSGVEWLGEVPEHWEALRLRFAVTLNPSKQEAKELGDQEVVSFLPMEVIGEDGSLRLEHEKQVAECLSGCTYFRNGDVCLAKITPCFENGKGAILRELKGGIGFGTTELIVARPEKEKITSEFVDCLFRSQTFRRLGESEMYGAGGQKRVPDSFVRDFVAALPSIEEQSQITNFLDRETAKIDALIAQQQRLIELLQEKRLAVISHAVTKGLNPDAPLKDSGVEWLGEVPEHWNIKRLKHLCASIEQGWSPQCENESSDGYAPGVLKVGCVNGGVFRPSENKKLPPDLSPIPEYSVRSGDLLISRANTKELVGSAAVVSEDFPWLYICDKLYRITVSPGKATANYLALFLASNEARGQIGLGASGASQSMQNISQSVLMDLPIPLPYPEEQEIIRNAIAIQCDQIGGLTAEASESIALLHERRSALISAAVTGQIDVRGLVPEAEAA